MPQTILKIWLCYCTEMESMESDDLTNVEHYLRDGKYLVAMSKIEKRRLREKCQSFRLVNDVLHHIGRGQKTCRVVKDITERESIVKELHAGYTSPHTPFFIAHRFKKLLIALL